MQAQRVDPVAIPPGKKVTFFSRKLADSNVQNPSFNGKEMCFKFHTEGPGCFQGPRCKRSHDTSAASRAILSAWITKMTEE